MPYFQESKNLTIAGGTFNDVGGNLTTSDRSTHIANYHRGSAATNNYRGRNVNNITNNGTVKGQMYHGGVHDRDGIGERHGQEYDYASSDEGSEAERYAQRYDTAKDSKSNKQKKRDYGITNNFEGTNVNNVANNGVVKGQMYHGGTYSGDRVRDDRSTSSRSHGSRKDYSRTKPQDPPQATGYTDGYAYPAHPPSTSSSNNGVPDSRYARPPTGSHIYAAPQNSSYQAPRHTGYGAAYNNPYTSPQSTHAAPSSYSSPPMPTHYAPASFTYRV